MDQKTKYLLNRVEDITFRGALGRARTYSDKATKDQKEDFRVALVRKLENLAPMYKTPVSEDRHILNITNLSNNLSKSFGTTLHGGRFRIGSAQKALNLYLKLLWCLGIVDEPPHCPFDSIVAAKLRLTLKWTQLDDIEEYRSLVAETKKIVEPQSIAQWELETFNAS